MWRPEQREALGPDRATFADVDPLNRVFSEAFTDRYGRDGMVGVRVPHLNALVWRFAIEDAAEGAMLWRDHDGDVVGFNMVHRSGTEGWMGPIAVRPDHQSAGLGSRMVQAGIDWLRERGATTIGLETMPRTVDNIGFYSRLGFEPGHLTITLTRDVGGRRESAATGDVLSRAPAGTLAECRELTARLAPGVDFTREFELTRELRLGDAALVRRRGRLAGFALWHSTPLAAGRPKDEVRVLKIVAEDLAAFEAVLEEVQAAARAERVRRVAVRCQSDFHDAYARLVALGYRVHWTDLRMTLRGYPAVPVPHGIVMSNWEI